MNNTEALEIVLKAAKQLISLHGEMTAKNPHDFYQALDKVEKIIENKHYFLDATH